MTETSFSFFHYTKNSCKRCCIAIDTPTMTNQSDAESSRICREQCEFVCWPFCITFDIISCPCRFSHFAYHNVSCNCKCKSCCKKKQPKFTIKHHNDNVNNVINKQPNNC
jgi:hypothetical protein